MHLNEPSDLGGGRGLNMYGGSPVQTGDGGILRVQDSSAASGPHIRIYFQPSLHGSPQPHLSLEAAIELRDRLNQAIKFAGKNWGRGTLRNAYRNVTQRRAAERKGKEAC